MSRASKIFAILSLACSGFAQDGLAPQPFTIPTGGVWWTCLEGTGTSVLDRTGGGNTLSLVGSPSWGTGFYRGQGTGVVLNGSTQWGNAGSFGNLQGTNFTISFWVRHTTAPVNGEVFASKGAFGTTGFYLQYQSTQLQLNVASGASANSTYGSCTLVGTNLYNIVFVRSNSVGYIYTNGVALTMTSNAVPTISSTTSNWFFGTYNGTAGNCVPGTMTDFRVYVNKVLNTNEIARNYLAGPRTKL